MIYVVVALGAEARPLISHLQLERFTDRVPLAVHRRSDLALAVAGVGKEAMRVAIDTLAKAVPSDTPPVWLNVGVAGHRQHEIGTPVLAAAVIDSETGDQYLLSPPEGVHLQTAEVRTVSHVETKYELDCLYEMEASAFCGRTFDLTRVALIQVLKIVSDNRRTGTLCVSARQVQGLIEDNLPGVDRLISSLHREARKAPR